MHQPGGQGQPLLDRIDGLQDVLQRMQIACRGRGRAVEAGPNIERANAVATGFDQVVSFAQAVGRHLAARFNDASTPGIRRGIANAAKFR